MEGMGERLRELRGERTQAEIASAIGIKSVTYATYENAQRDPTYKTLIKLADLHGVTTDYLLCRTDCKSPDVEIQGICQKTGLSNKAVDALVELNQSDLTERYAEENIQIVHPWIYEWSERKKEVYTLLNLLLTWPMLDEIIFLTQKLNSCIESKKMTISNIGKEKFRDFLENTPEELKELILYPTEYQELKIVAVNEQAKKMADALYRLLRYGTTQTYDSLDTIGDFYDLEMAMMEDMKNAET